MKVKISVTKDGLTYLINEEEKKQKLLVIMKIETIFLIPRSIKYESQEYIIQNISKNAFQFSQNIKSIEFSSDENAFYFCNQLQRLDIPSNSELQTIEEEAFSDSYIESIFIPASLIDLKEGWCISANKLTTVKVDPRNLRYKNYNNEMIICKRTETNENYEEIVFCRRDIKEITIPLFIKIIGSNSFSNCKQLQRLDIPTNSELQTIEK